MKTPSVSKSIKVLTQLTVLLNSASALKLEKDQSQGMPKTTATAQQIADVTKLIDDINEATKTKFQVQQDLTHQQQAAEHQLASVSSQTESSGSSRQKIVQDAENKSIMEKALEYSASGMYSPVLAESKQNTHVTVHKDVQTISLAQASQSSSEEETATNDSYLIEKQEVTALDAIISAFGLLFALYGILIVQVSEKYNVYYSQFFQKLKENVIRLAEPRAYPMNNGMLVHLSGRSKNEGLVRDNTLDLDFDNVSKVTRSVEMLQFEKDHSSGTCKPVWNDVLIGSTNVSEYQNPTSFPFQTENFYCKQVLVGDFQLTKSQLRSLKGEQCNKDEVCRRSRDLMQGLGYTALVAENDMYYAVPLFHLQDGQKEDDLFRDLDLNKLDEPESSDQALSGAIRVKFEQVQASEINIFGKQLNGENGNMVDYYLPNDISNIKSQNPDEPDSGIYAFMGSLFMMPTIVEQGVNLAWKQSVQASLNEKLDSEKDLAKTKSTWVVRIFSFLYLYCSLSIFFTPITTSFMWIPMFEKVMISSESNYYSVGQLEAFMFLMFLYPLVFGLVWFGKNGNYCFFSLVTSATSLILMFTISP